jgi:hypothetical protein
MALGGRYRELHDRQYALETDRFVNPGEDFTPELGGPAPMLTDAKGRLAVGGLLPGRWALEVRKPGFMSFRAEIVLAGGEKPRIAVASQHNVPGAESTMRVRLGRVRGAPPAPARVERATVAPRAEAPRSATPRPPSSAPPMPVEPSPLEATAVPAPEVPPPSASPPSPEPASAPPAASAEPEVASPTPVAPARPPAVTEAASQPAPTPEPAERLSAQTRPSPPAPAVSPPARVTVAAPIARACYECRPGESALLAESEIAAGGGSCPAGLRERMAAMSRAEIPTLAAALPGGCAVMVVDLPANARYVGFRFEAAGGNGRSEDCLPGRECPAGGCRFPTEPVIRDEGGTTWLLALFESAATRRGGFTVYWRRTR